MRIINTSVCAFQNKVLVIGFEGENERTQVRIDASEVFTEYPHATPSLTVKPNSGEAYPATVNRDGTDVVWDITSSYLTERGECEIQLTFIKDSVVCKSYIGKALVLRSLTVEGEMPTPVESWVDAANAKLAEVDAQIVELEGMVDTATDAAERAAESAEIATEEAVHAEGSAETATAKANEATNAAGTATAKAAEAEQSALTATEKATAAAESERIATAKAVEATTAAGTATAKAEQATEAAQTATEKAGDASASARAAQASATDAASSATAASASETAAKASETAASTSATQAAQSAQGASANAQTAMQKAAEATQSATNAAASATSAATSAETASTKAGEAAQSAQAVAETAEQLAESLEQISQNTADIAEHEQEYNALKAATLIHNTASGAIASFVDGAEMPVDEVTVQINPVQDLHGYDHPWPAGGGKNLLPKGGTSNTYQGVTVSYDSENEIYTLNGTVNSVATIYLAFPRVESMTLSPDKTYSISCRVVSGSFVLGNDSSTTNTYSVACFSKNLLNYFRGSLSLPESALDGYSGYGRGFETESYYCVLVQCWKVGTVFNNLKIKIQIEEGQTATAWTPYENLCPISGWDGVKVTRTGKNLFNVDSVSIITAKGNNYVGNEYTKLVGNITVSASEKSTGHAIYAVVKRANGTYDSDRLIASTTTATYYTIAMVTGDVLWILDASARFASQIDSAKAELEHCKIQLEFGNKTDYEPYSGNTYSITLPTEAGTVYGGELTVNADGSGSLVVDRKVIVFDGSDNYTWTYAPNYYCMICVNQVSDMEYGVKISDYQNSYGIVVHRTAITLKQLQFGSSLSPIEGVASSVEEWKSKLNENPIQVVYPLATIQTYTLTASQIRTLLGTNNVWADTGDVSVKYNADTKLYIDGKIAELVAQIVNS